VDADGDYTPNAGPKKRKGRWFMHNIESIEFCYACSSPWDVNIWFKGIILNTFLTTFYCVKKAIVVRVRSPAMMRTPRDVPRGAGLGRGALQVELNLLGVPCKARSQRKGVNDVDEQNGPVLLQHSARCPMGSTLPRHARGRHMCAHHARTWQAHAHAHVSPAVNRKPYICNVCP